MIRRSRLKFYGFHKKKKIYALYRIIKTNETGNLWHSACLRSMPRTTMTLHISLLHTLLQMCCWSRYGDTNYSVYLKSMQRIILHVFTFTAVSASDLLTEGWTDKQTGVWFENWNAYETLLGGLLFPCSPEINWLVSLFPKNLKLFSYVPCSLILPLYHVPLKIRPWFPVTLE